MQFKSMNGAVNGLIPLTRGMSVSSPSVVTRELSLVDFLKPKPIMKMTSCGDQ